MQTATWYLGPLGDLRPLPSPDGGVDRTVERFGGVHQSLSGARTMDITGHRASYTFTLPWLEPSETRFIEALHYRTVPGPFYALDPMTSNRLPRDAALLKPYSDDVDVPGGGVVRSTDAPTGPGVPVTSLDWSSYTAGTGLTLPSVPLLPNEGVVASVWARSEDAIPLTISVAFTGAAGTDQGHATQTVTLSTGWARYSVAATVPGTAASGRVSFTPGSGKRVLLAGAQFEFGSAPSPWDMGGGAPTVLLDQLERSSSHYPGDAVTLTLLEV